MTIHEIARGPGWELRLGRWQDVLDDVLLVDALITDPPFSNVTHEGQPEDRDPLAYQHFTEDDVREFVYEWLPRTSGWFCAITDDVLSQVWRQTYRDLAGTPTAPTPRLDFASVPILRHNPRRTGDGPGSGACYMMVCRPRQDPFSTWGSLPCWYEQGAPARGGIIGEKSLSTMRAIVRDYTRRGNRVCDPCAGRGTTLLAAVMEGREAIGAEADPGRFELAVRRLQAGIQQPLLGDA